jgi:hypothetical protein
MRKSITAALSTALLAGALLAGSPVAGPASAQAAGCKWGMPSQATIKQGNNHQVKLTYDRANGYWKARAFSNGEHKTSSSEVAFTSFTPRLVKFIITWYDDTAGVYTATIDSDGFVSGVTRDRFNPSSKTDWHMTTRARCGR